jgi:phospholipid N-methyltransferase
MNQKLKTSFQFTKNLLTTGAFSETSKKVEKEICKHIPKRSGVVVEFGMGHGNITRQILNKMSDDARLFSFEVNNKFCEHVRQNLKDDRLTIVNDSAENVKKYVDSNVIAIISSIPFSFLSKETSKKVLTDSYEILLEDCYLSQVLYTKFNFKKFEKIFDQCEMITYSHIPTEHIYHCLKTSKI